MNDSKYRYILYIIVIVILSTIGIQAYWNYKNYLSNKQQLINDVQTSLDKAVDDYYANLAENSTIGFSLKGMSQKDFIKNGRFDSIISSISESDTDGFGSIDSINPNLLDGVSIVKGPKADSIINQMQLEGIVKFQESDSNIIKHIQIDSLSKQSKNEHLEFSEADLKTFTSKIIISMTTDSLSLRGIDTLVQKELLRKDIGINYTIKYKDPSTDIDYYNATEKDIEFIDSIQLTSFLSTTSKSALLPKKSELSLLFNNVSSDVLKRIVWGITISTLLVLAVISCLFYLLQIIKRQKQLAEVKNDLISNITHEFKTPIATIGVALESLQSFNMIDDETKRKTYLNMSRSQLSKLNTMVEKLLETATLNSDNLELNFDTYNISEVITTLVEKHKFNDNSKTIITTIEDAVFAHVDVFHFENAINNMIDNAFKYGGDTIYVNLKKNIQTIDISIADNGSSLTKADKVRVFEKFYRVPKGNTHDVKGFGIGLYYTNEIIKKHKGSIQLDLKSELTTFKIQLPNV
ncbi:sensor histidine kinase [Psychroserpens damuponensis]|uniref:sensor histidine kinase n=1 Tax=Psychroserpens damuponensis TaxID=943936 RepID=UPI00058C075E|nr:HAMP domain-containing sensor histidine kinase [Psychroserpens damuponensis]